MDEKLNKNLIVLLLGLAGFVVTADNWVVAPILPAISQSFGIDVGSSGLLVSAYMLPFGVFQIIMGPLSDRYGKKQVLTLSIITFTIATGLCALGTNLTNLAFIRALTGVFASSLMPISIALIGDMFPMHERQKAISTFMGIAYLGQGLSMIIGGSIAYLFSWRGVFAVYAVFSLIPTLLFIKLYKTIPSEKNPKSEMFRPYLRMISKYEYVSLLGIVFLEGMFIIGSFSYVGAFISEVFNFNYLKIGLIMTGFGVMTLAGGRAGSKAVKTTGAKNMVAFGLLSAATANLLLYYLGTNIYMVVIAVSLLGLGFILTHSTLMTQITGMAHTSRGTAMGLLAFSFMGGGAIGTALGGRIVTASDLKHLFLIFGTALIVTLILSLLTLRNLGAREAVPSNA
ncbi:MFS transporter [Seleniivibrio sp.]|uniref:MFS transporter n=1 Tax=Seleniivibrio sp. TaxID=2898801 RepID=UPI0025F7A2AE|nr:MFS transporter [Seleniivibrio sp.]MCD8553369.1 MFS transporter [Seleniivibrio sp.]